MPKRILVADDDPAMLKVYERLLARLDHSVEKAATFAEAAALIAERDFDLLITDLMFPDGLGTDLIESLNKKRAGAQSLLVTGSVRELPPEKRPSSYFEKPFDVNSFMAAVAAALE
ncbi:MAG: response regulator [Elusimicrobiales bacterium]|jgi:DNA-binding NtrC family response regulator|nr:response regulator [Elusimicrobiales bacterium]